MQGHALLQSVRSAMLDSPDITLGDAAFNALALSIFRHQFVANSMYRKWCMALGWSDQKAKEVAQWREIPCMPVEAFKWGEVTTQGVAEEASPMVFRTSGTTGQNRGAHHVHTPALYAASAHQGFQRQFGPPDPQSAVLLALLPGYLERSDSSLVHMVCDLRASGWRMPDRSVKDGFYLHDFEGLFRAIDEVLESGRRPVVMGVTWALVDAAQAWKDSGRAPLSSRVRLVETGGMKGQRKEWVREEVHGFLKAQFGCQSVEGEYGMTELLSQAWSKGDGQYVTPPWMRIRVRRTDDPLSIQADGATGGLDVMDLANVGSCSFLSTQDLVRPWGKEDGRGFEVLGRFDHSEVRGCNLLVV